MNSFSLIIFFVLVVLHQSQSSYNYEKFIEWEPKDSVACYKTLILNFFDDLKTVVPKYCVIYGQNELKSKVTSRDQYYALIKKDGLNRELFIAGKNQAKEIGSKTINNIHRCLAYDCNQEKHAEVNKLTNRFRKRSTECGDSEYLSEEITTLEQTCAEGNSGNIPKRKASHFAGNKGGIHGGLVVPD